MGKPGDELSVALARALAGEQTAARDLVRALRPVIQARVTRVLVKYRGAARGRPLEQEVDDLVQQVFAGLFAEGAKELRAHDPELGLGLLGYVGLVAERDALSTLRSRRQSPFTEEPTEEGALSGTAAGWPSPEREAQDRELLRQVVAKLREELSSKGAAIFEMLVVEERPVEQVCATLGMTTDAVYAWRSRIAKRARIIASELSSDSPKPPRIREGEAPNV